MARIIEQMTKPIRQGRMMLLYIPKEGWYRYWPLQGAAEIGGSAQHKRMGQGIGAGTQAIECLVCHRTLLVQRAAAVCYCVHQCLRVYCRLLHLNYYHSQCQLMLRKAAVRSIAHCLIKFVSHPGCPHPPCCQHVDQEQEHESHHGLVQEADQGVEGGRTRHPDALQPTTAATTIMSRAETQLAWCAIRAMPMTLLKEHSGQLALLGLGLKLHTGMQLRLALLHTTP